MLAVGAQPDLVLGGQILATALSADGNVFVAGGVYFKMQLGNVVLAPLYTSGDGFVAKYSPTTGFVWAVSFASAATATNGGGSISNGFAGKRADNGEIVQFSEGYTIKAACENGIQRVKAHCPPQRFESFRESGQHGFNHVAANGEIIGRSEQYPAAPASSRAHKPVSSASHSQRRGCRGQQTYWKQQADGAA